MSEIFLKIKNKFFRNAVLCSVLTGVSGGLAVTGLLLIALKLCEVGLNVGFYVLIGVLVALVGGGIAFLVLRPTDKKVAKRLDREYALNEKIQTMVEFSGNEGEMPALQREDASARLGSVAPRRPALSKIISAVLIPVLACALFLTGVLIPVDEGQPEPSTPDDGFELTNWQTAALQQLIDEVEASSLDGSLKSSVNVVLRGLLEALEEADTGSAMKAQVISAVALTDGMLDGANTYSAVCLSLNGYELLTELSAAFESAVGAYSAGVTKLTSFGQVTEIEKGLYTAADEVISAYFTATEEEFSLATDFSAFAELAQEYIAAFTGAYADMNADENDGLFKAVAQYCAALEGIGGRLTEDSGYGVPALNKQITEADTVFRAAAASSLAVQSYNAMMKDYIRTTLSDIFSVTFGGQTDDGENGGSDGKDDNEEENGGGHGRGDIVYGSNDLIYYPDTETYVEYGTVLAEYYARILELMADLPEEQQHYITEYFSILFSGLED